jgi:hypothetical protein
MHCEVRRVSPPPPPLKTAAHLNLHKLSTSQHPHSSPEDGDSMFTRNVCVYTVSQPKYQPSYSVLFVNVSVVLNDVIGLVLRS